MSEYQTPESLERLLGDAAKGDEAAALIASVRKQPFSVLLLDEFEKAHTNIWDVFLQVFDDGRLTDRNGRTADLRHCVIILTSNLGSAIPRGPGLGFGGRSGAFDAATVVKSVERSFRPEFLNRLDRVVVFRPLGREIMRSLLENELTAVLRRRGFRMQPWAVEWDEAAVDFLIEQGFSAELGARPLKRAVEQHLLTRIATAIVERQFPAGDQFLFITARDGTGLDVAFVDPDADETPPAASPAAGLTLAGVALEPQGSEAEAAYLRAELDSLEEGVASWETRKEDMLARTRDHTFWQAEERFAVLGLIEYLDRLGAATATARRLAARLAGRDAHSRELVQLLARRLHVLAAALAGLEAGDPSDATVTVRAGHADDAEACAQFVQELAAMYVGWADTRGMRIRRGGDTDKVVLEVSGLGAYTLLRPETGLHVLELPVPETLVRPRHRGRQCRAGRWGRRRGDERRGACRRAALPARTVAARPRRGRNAYRPDRPRARGRLRPVLGELLADELADGGAVGATRDLRHHVGHHAADVAHARGADLGDHVVDDRLQLVLGDRLGHELLEHVELVLFLLGLLLPTAGAERLGRLEPLLALALQHLELLVVVQRALQLLLRSLKAGEDQAQRVAARGIAVAHRALELFLDLCDKTHCVLSSRHPADPPTQNVPM